MRKLFLIIFILLTSFLLFGCTSGNQPVSMDEQKYALTINELNALGFSFEKEPQMTVSDDTLLSGPTMLNYYQVFSVGSVEAGNGNAVFYSLTFVDSNYPEVIEASYNGALIPFKNSNGYKELSHPNIGDKASIYEFNTPQGDSLAVGFSFKKGKYFTVGSIDSENGMNTPDIAEQIARIVEKKIV